MLDLDAAQQDAAVNADELDDVAVHEVRRLFAV